MGNNVTLTPVNLAATIEDSLAVVGKSLPQKQISLHAKNGGLDIHLLADDMLQEVFVNLFSNSAKYTDGKDVNIEVATEIVGRECRIRVSDYGRGISPEQKPGLFTRYVKNAQGTGLGLSIAHALVVERYGGTITVKDRIIGDHSKGTLVEISLSAA